MLPLQRLAHLIPQEFRVIMIQEMRYGPKMLKKFVDAHLGWMLPRSTIILSVASSLRLPCIKYIGGIPYEWRTGVDDDQFESCADIKLSRV